MKIEKIKNFNQYVLAVVASLGAILMLVFVVMALGELFRDMKYWFRPAQNQNIVAEDVAQKNLKENKRTHLVSFKEFILVDTVRQVYLMPVSQTKLLQYEKMDDGLLSLTNKVGSRDSYGYNYYSSNNNILIYSGNSFERKVFDKRVNINEIHIEKVKQEPIVLLAVIHEDSNKDNVLEEGDLRTLHIYSTKNKKLHSIKVPNSTFLNFHILNSKNEVVIRLGLDRNKNGKFDWDEPAIFKHYSLTDKTLTDLVNKELMQELQATLDGK